jgi:dipeptidyl aminopeptidase/acylaminoacyl peptidase
LVENLHIIDPRRIGVWGWSYGGYTTLRILSEEKQNLFQCGIAVAPVTNWRFYGTAFFFVDFHFTDSHLVDRQIVDFYLSELTLYKRHNC